VYFRSLAEYTALGVLREKYLNFLELIFVPAWWHASENLSIVSEAVRAAQ